MASTLAAARCSRQLNSALLQLVMANVTCHIQLTLLGPAPSPPPGCAQCDPRAQQPQSEHHDNGNTAPNSESHWHTADPPGSAASSHHPVEQHPAQVVKDRCAHCEPTDAAAADFAAYLDDWCARASVPGSLEHAVAEIDRQESLDQETANAHQYDDEAFEAWFAPIADAAAELEFAPFGTADTCSPAYRVPAHIRRFVELRDEHCRYPGCSRGVKYCEADHVIPWGTPGGHTTPSNLQLLCKRHHRVKTAKRWSVTMTRDGDCTWTSPTGSVHITRPALTLS
ncbi:HNH endonuclease signature motif containing protein [Yimella sp. cx-51]|uniref:HNH endonuclease signature motif containing protein n=1 Tax=Yimella sp. cx-51 TaxID=2770551 RepID=UPI001AD88C7A|nr:HNH endonuclease signature motif containing protein [Yimella sp. cx-51]QTH38329.1 HNH endonuclease [Yimella sp. cx-51]